MNITIMQIFYSENKLWYFVTIFRILFNETNVQNWWVLTVILNHFGYTYIRDCPKRFNLY